MAGKKKLASKEIEREVKAIYRRHRQIRKMLDVVGISLDNWKRLKKEEVKLDKRLAVLRTICSHPLTDKSTGGGIFCSICDKFLKYD